MNDIFRKFVSGGLLYLKKTQLSCEIIKNYFYAIHQQIHKHLQLVLNLHYKCSSSSLQMNWNSYAIQDICHKRCLPITNKNIVISILKLNKIVFCYAIK